jgi:hypothetical protein
MIDYPHAKQNISVVKDMIKAETQGHLEKPRYFAKLELFAPSGVE